MANDAGLYRREQVIVRSMMLNERAVWAAGASRLYWLTKEDNRTARALYDKLAERSGFIQYRKLF